jgi:putative Mg2+ transporter-C (MgtC) family protein
MQDFDILLRLFVAMVLAGILGWERESTGKAAGVRTHMLVGLGAALFVVLGELFVFRFRQYDENMRFDPIRIIEAVVTGISFLGAGTIFVSRGRGRVKGLTTAASIWATAAVGLAVGLERYLLAALSTALIFVVLRVLGMISFVRDDEGGP